MKITSVRLLLRRKTGRAHSHPRVRPCRSGRGPRTLRAKQRVMDVFVLSGMRYGGNSFNIPPLRGWPRMLAALSTISSVRAAERGAGRPGGGAGRAVLLARPAGVPPAGRSAHREAGEARSGAVCEHRGTPLPCPALPRRARPAQVTAGRGAERREPGCLPQPRGCGPPLPADGAARDAGLSCSLVPPFSRRRGLCARPGWLRRSAALRPGRPSVSAFVSNKKKNPAADPPPTAFQAPAEPGTFVPLT